MRGRRTSLRRSAVILAALLFLAGIYLASESLTVRADVSDDDAHVGFLGPDGDEDDRGPRYLVRNLVDGHPIPVCSTDYPIAAPEAVERWNTALGINVFRFLAARGACDTEERRRSPRKGVVSLTVSKGSWSNVAETEYRGAVLPKSCSRFAWGGCAGFAMGNRTWRTYYGRAEIIMHPQNRGTDGNDPGLIRDIAHEMGHVLALADYFCNVPGYMVDVSDHPDRIDSPWFRTLMNSFTARSECNSPDGRPTQRDVSDYRTIYIPAAVTAAAGSSDQQTVVLTWDQSEVFAASGFEIRWWDDGEWKAVATVGANEESVELTDQRGGENRFRIVGVTNALASASVGHGHAHGPASDDVTVTVRFPQPGNPRVTARGAQSLSFTWDPVRGADGYDVRIRRSTDRDCEAQPDQEHPVSGQRRALSGLNPSTTYLFCVRATLAGHPKATSDWAPTSGTTTARSVSPPRPTTKTCPDGSVVPVAQDCPIPPKPAPVVEIQKARQITEYQWRLYADGVPGALPPNPPGTCYWELYKRERYTLADFQIPWRWDETERKWVLDRSEKKQVGLETDYIYTHWRAAGDRRDLTCPGAGGQEGGADAPPTLRPGVLLPGDYVTVWGGERYQFTIPSGAEVAMQVGTNGGQQAMVFSLASGDVVVVVPSQVSAAPPQTDNPTLSAIVQSFRPKHDSSGPEEQTCAKSPERDNAGVLNLDLDTQWCTIVRGGEVAVGVGPSRITLTLPAGRSWLILAAPRSATSDATGVWIIDQQSKSHIILDPASGAELGRQLTEAGAALGALFDAMLPQANGDAS